MIFQRDWIFVLSHSQKMRYYKGHCDFSSMIKMGTHIFSLLSLDLPLCDMTTIPMVDQIFCLNNDLSCSLNSLLRLNFKKEIDKMKLNSEFDETNAIRFLTKSIVRGNFNFFKYSKFSFGRPS